MSEPGFRRPAPPALRLVQRFINTNDLEGGQEQLASRDALASWLLMNGLLVRARRVSALELTSAVELREALRTLASAHNNLPADTVQARRVINQAGARAGLQPCLDEGETSLLYPHAGPVDAALGIIVAHVHSAIALGIWSRLKACERDRCRWAFFDYSRNRSGRWCHTDICGSRERGRRAYTRRRSQKPARN